MEASGLCHTDIHAANGDWPVKPTPPFIPGHEGVGIVTAVGAGGYRAGIDPRAAAPLTCAGVTTYKAVKVGNEP